MTDRIVGVISDTHRLLRAEALHALEGADLILHAGDVGDPGILEALAAIAPVRAVRGNVDIEPWAASLPVSEVVDVGERLFYMLHDLSQLDLDPAAAGFAAVIHGHSHRPSIEQKNGVLYLNPGSAGPRRFKLPITLARVVVSGKDLRAEIVAILP